MLWQCIKWVPDLYKYAGSCLQFAFLSVVKEYNVLPASYFQNLHLSSLATQYTVGVLEYLILWIFIFDYKSNDVWDFSLFHFSLLSTSRFICSHFFLALVKHKKYINFFSAFFKVQTFCMSFANYHKCKHKIKPAIVLIYKVSECHSN